jgi:cell division protein FtsA
MPSNPVVALEIGTAKVRALVGEEREDGYLMITGIGECPSRGIRKGDIVDFENALACVEQALKLAEETSRVSINQVYVVVTGAHIQGAISRGTTPIIPADSEITTDHIEDVLESARAISLGQDRRVLHSIHQQYYVDDQPGVVNPEGMVGAKLSVSMLIIHGVRNRILNLLKVASSAHVQTAGCAFGGLCAGLAVLTAEQKESGCVVIDLGAGTTDYLIYADRCIALAGSLGIGGDHITNDLSMVLRIPTAAAEKLKIDQGIVAPGENLDQPVTIQPSGGFAGKTVKLVDVNAIITARLEETLGMISDQLRRNKLNHVMGAGVVLTGGGAHLKNIEPFVSSVMHMPCTIGRPRNVSGIATATEGPEYASTVGMLRYGIRSSDKETSGLSLRTVLGRMFGR